MTVRWLCAGCALAVSWLSVQGSEVIFTDDVSLQVFMDHLKRLAVQS